MQGKKILVTGGCGYIGSRVAKALSEAGHDVRVVDIATPEEHKKVMVELPSAVEILTCDLREKSCAKKSLKGIHLVVHLAADIGPIGYMRDHQAEIMANNMAIDSVVYPTAVEAGVKTIIYSSSSMVFQGAEHYPYKESDLPLIKPPTNIYGFSKLGGEYFCTAFQKQYGLQYVVIRYHNVYGPGEDSKGSTLADIHVIPALIKKIISGQYPLELLGEVEATRPFTYVDDAVEATTMIIEEALKENPRVINSDFNIGSKDVTKIIDLARLIWELLGVRKELKYIVDKTDFNTAIQREMDPSKIEHLIGWAPKIGLKEGILKTAAWIRNARKI